MRILPLVVLLLVIARVSFAQNEVVPKLSDSKPTQVVTPYAPPQPDGDLSSGSVPTALESFETPSLEGSHLKLTSSLVGEVDEVDGTYTEEVIRVQWRPGDPIDLYVIKPTRVKNPPVILYLYSYPFETDRFRNHDFCKFLVRNGFAAVGFASALTGQRYHDVPMKEWFVSNLNESLAMTAHDVQMILNFLDSRGDLDMNRVGMFGDGSGGSIAILAAAVDSRIKTLDLLNPWGDWPDWIKESTRIPENERADYLKPDWLAQLGSLDPVLWLPRLKSQQLRLTFVKDLSITPPKVQSTIESAAPSNAEIRHYQDGASFKESVADGKGFDWIKQEVAVQASKDYQTAHQSHAVGSTNSQQ